MYVCIFINSLVNS